MRLQPMQQTRNGQEVAAVLRAQIQSGELPVGTRLPSQRDLAALLGIGRPSVREGLAHLEAEGYVVTKRGATGGSFVSAPSTPPSVWVELVRANIADLEDLIDWRIALESRIAYLAALRRTEVDLQVMRKAIDELADVPASIAEFRAADGAFHAALAKAAGNPRLENAARQARADLFMPTDNAPFERRIEMSRIQHADIADAVERHDAEAAQHAVVRHIESTREQLRLLVRDS